MIGWIMINRITLFPMNNRRRGSGVREALPDRFCRPLLPARWEGANLDVFKPDQVMMMLKGNMSALTA